MELAGKTVLITRAAHQAEGLVRLLQERGAIPVILPTISIVRPESWEETDRALRALSTYQGLIFTSANGVDFFFRRALECGTPLEAFRHHRVYVVGEKTGRVVMAHGLTVTALPEKFTSRDLAERIRQDPTGAGRLLFPRGDLGESTLPDALRIMGIEIDVITVYNTVPPSPPEAAEIRSTILSRKIDVVTFTSPSTARNFFALFDPAELRSLAEKFRIAVIGPVTAEAVRKLGYRVDMLAEESSSAGLVRSLVAFS